MAKDRQVFDIIARQRGFDKAGRKVSKFGNTLKKFAATLVTVQVAYMAFSKALEGVKLGAKIDALSGSFGMLTRDAGFTVGTLQKLQKATDGTVSHMDLMTEANNAMLLGIVDSNDQMAEMFDVAQRLAKAMGKDATFGIQSLTTGLGRQSKLMLDNLGLMVDTQGAYEDYAKELETTVSKLTDVQRKQAFVNAAMEQGKAKVAALGTETLGAAEKMDRMGASASNALAAFGRAILADTPELMGEISNFLDEMTVTFNVHADEVFRTSEEYTNMATSAKLAFDEIALANLKLSLKLVETPSSLTKAWAIAGDFYGFKPIMTMYENLYGILSGDDVYVNSWLKDFLDDNTELDTERIKELKKEIEDLENIISEGQSVEQMTKTSENARVSAEEIKNTTSEFDKYFQKQEEGGEITEGLTKAEKHRAKAVALSNSNIGGSMADLLETQKGTAEVTAALRIAQAIADTYAAANVALATGVPPFSFINAAAVTASGLANVAQIRNAYNEQKAQTGYEGVVDEPTTFTVGEGGAAEYVSVTPMEGVNNAGGGSQIIINNPIISSQYVEEELPELIAEAVRKGTSFGIV